MAGDKHDALVRNNQHQLEEALGADNRYFAWQHFGRAATDAECVWYYLEHGGAVGHRQRMKDSPPEYRPTPDAS